jgi:osmotically-inducible protein OsmY
MNSRFNKNRIMTLVALTDFGLAALGVSAATAYAQTESPVVHADNSKVNVRDRSEAEVTPGDQPSKGPDLKMTQDIRKAITDDKNLSTKAHNVKIITLGGQVTLKGPVASQTEKQTVVEIAKKIAGADRVTDKVGIAAK